MFSLRFVFSVHAKAGTSIPSGQLFRTLSRQGALVKELKKNSNIIFDTHYAKSFSPEFSDIIIFEDDIYHRANANEEELRISLAFNYVKCMPWAGIK